MGKIFASIVQEYSILSSRFSSIANELDTDISIYLGIGTKYPEALRRFRNNLVHGRYYTYKNYDVKIDYKLIKSDMEELYAILNIVVKLL